MSPPRKSAKPERPRKALHPLRRISAGAAAGIIALAGFGAIGHALNGVLDGALNPLCAVPAPVILVEHPPSRESRPDAAEIWNLVKSQYMLPGCSVFMDSTGISLGPVSLGAGWGGNAWEQSQGIAAALDVARLTGNYHDAAGMIKALSIYREGRDGYSSSSTGLFPRYFDDNGWLGLDFMQAYRQTGIEIYLHQAEHIFKFLQTGQHSYGGMRWNTSDHSPGNMPATGSDTEFALELYQATHKAGCLKFAEKNISFMDQYLKAGPESPHAGLYWDSVTRSGGHLVPVKRLLSYNQGTAMGAHLLMYQITGNPQYLKDAQETANASLNHFHGDVLWKQPPVFNAIFFRNLMALNEAAPSPRYVKAFDQYLNRVWNESRNPKTGLFDQGGIGHYGPSSQRSLDQAGLVQLFALRQTMSRSHTVISSPPGLPTMVIKVPAAL